MAALRKVLLAPLVLVPTLLVLALAAYAALGFWGVLWLVRSQATAYVRDTLHRELRMGEVTFNPFTFKLTLRDVMIEIPAGPVTTADKAALDDAKFQAAIAEFRTGKRGADTPYEELGDKDKIDVLADLYRREFGKKPEIPDAQGMQSERTAANVAQLQGEIALDAPVNSDIVLDQPASQGDIVLDAPPSTAIATNAAPAAEPTRRERKAARRSSEVEWLEAQLRPRFKADATASTELSRTRALAVQEALLANGKVDPARVFADTSKSPTDQKEVVRMELALE